MALTGIDKARRIAGLMCDKKGEDILILDVVGICNFTDYFVLCTGQSRLQLNALSAHVEQTLKHKDDERPVSRDGHKSTNWVVIDYGDVIAHLMTPEIRDYYRLEDIWGDADFTAWTGADVSATESAR